MVLELMVVLQDDKVIKVPFIVGERTKFFLQLEWNEVHVLRAITSIDHTNQDH